MFQTLVSTENLSKEEWLKWRMKGLGGSDAAVACGLNRYKSPVQLWMEKRGILEIEQASEAVYWGNMMEPIIRNEFTKRTGVAVNELKSILQHKDYPFMLANLDGITEDGRYVFEAKTASAYKAGEWEDGIPDEYMIQIQHYMAVAELDGAYIAVLVGGNTFKWQFVPRDEELINMLFELEHDFWYHVENRIPPPVDGSEACTALLNRLFPAGQPKQLTLPDDAINLINEYELYQEQEKNATLSKDRVANSLKMMLSDNEIGVIGERVVSWKNVSVGRLDTGKVKEQHPEIFTQCLNTSSYRRFTIK